MSDFVVLAWRDEAERQAQDMKARLVADESWRLAVDGGRMAVFLSRERPLPLLRLPGVTGVVIGSVFDTAEAVAGRGQAADLSRLCGDHPIQLCRRLSQQAWGSYVAVLPDGDGAPNTFRDPLGGLECLTWRRDGVFVIASRLDPRAAHAPADLAIDWDAVGALLRQKNLSSATVPLHGAQGVNPGVVRGPDGRWWRLWAPAQFARSRHANRKARPEDLAAVIDGCVAAWAKGCSGALCEVSGGLDSAIVVAALQRVRAPIVGAINHYWAQPEADERAFARIVAEHAGLQLTERAHDLLCWDAEKLAKVAGSARPSFSAADANYDAGMAASFTEFGADSLFTGQGGDAVFYQMAPAALVVDILLGGHPAKGRLSALATLAHRSRRTIWSLLSDAMKRRRMDGGAHVSFLTDDAAAPQPGDRHPWLQDFRGVSRAKQVQIQALTNNQSMFGDSLRARAGRLIQPLLSQPVVELCLSIPAPMLAVGDTDRPLARAAYAERLPAAVLRRRWKGDLSVFFAQSMAESLPFLRSFLLEGRLAGQGLIDRERLEAILHCDELIWFDHSGELTAAVILEAWVRHWEAAAS